MNYEIATSLRRLGAIAPRNDTSHIRMRRIRTHSTGCPDPNSYTNPDVNPASFPHRDCYLHPNAVCHCDVYCLPFPDLDVNVYCNIHTGIYIPGTR